MMNDSQVSPIVARRAEEFKDSKVDPKLVNTDRLKFIPDKFKVSGDGIFYTLQGEGVTQGLPALFLRLHICNLQCIWCDSWYTWNKNTPEFWTESNDWGVDDTYDKLMKLWYDNNKSGHLPRVVITGGEPTMQQALIEKLWLKAPTWDWEIETNGTIPLKDIIVNHFQINCSPKLENSKNIKALRYKPEVLKQIRDAKNSWFKFVVMYESDLDEIQKDFVDTGLVKHHQVILMPQGITAEEINKHARNVAEYAKVKGFRLLLRLQTELWGTRRRV